MRGSDVLERVVMLQMGRDAGVLRRYRVFLHMSTPIIVIVFIVIVVAAFVLEVVGAFVFVWLSILRNVSAVHSLERG